MDAQSALRPDQPTGCSASLYAAARSKTSVDRKRLVATTMTEYSLATPGPATAFHAPVTKATIGLKKIRAFSHLPRGLFTHGRPRLLCSYPQLSHGFRIRDKSRKPCQDTQPFRGPKEPCSGSSTEVSDPGRERDLRRSVRLIKFVLLDTCQGGDLTASKSGTGTRSWRARSGEITAIGEVRV